MLLVLPEVALQCTLRALRVVDAAAVAPHGALEGAGRLVAYLSAC